MVFARSVVYTFSLTDEREMWRAQRVWWYRDTVDKEFVVQFFSRWQNVERWLPARDDAQCFRPTQTKDNTPKIFVQCTPVTVGSRVNVRT
jgi:hypothetical protein